MSPGRGPRRLGVVWLLLAFLAAVIVLIEYRDYRRGTPESARETDGRVLLATPVDELGAIEIADRGRLHRFERDAAGVWFYHGTHTQAAAAHSHTPDPALADRIARTFAAFGRARIERQFPLDRESGAYGVAAPELVVLAYRRGESQPLAQYAFGHVAPDTVSQYMMVVGSPVVGTIPKYHVDNLLALLGVAAGAPGPDPGGRRPEPGRPPRNHPRRRSSASSGGPWWWRWSCPRWRSSGTPRGRRA